MENFNSHFNTLYMEISPQSASFSAHNRFYGIIKTPGNLNEDLLVPVPGHAPHDVTKARHVTRVCSQEPGTDILILMATILNQSIILPLNQGRWWCNWCFEWKFPYIESLNDRRKLLLMLILMLVFPRCLRQGVTWQSSPCLAPPAPEYGTHTRGSCSPRPRPRLAPRPTAAPWSRQPQLSRPAWRTAVFTFLRPSPGGKLARIIVYKITIHNCLILAWVGRSSLSGAQVRKHPAWENPRVEQDAKSRVYFQHSLTQSSGLSML